MIRTLFRELEEILPYESIDKKGWVKWGDDNLYPQFLNSLYYDNPVHQGIVDQKVKFITAGGLTVESGDATILNNYGAAYSLQEVMEMATKDYEIGGMYAIRFVKSRVKNAWIAEHFDYELVRRTEHDIYYVVSDDWSVSQQSFAKTGYKQIKNIQYVTPEDTECMMVYFAKPKQRSLGEKKNKKLTANYYPEVPYVGAISSIRAGIEMDYFTLSEVVNGYKGGTLISLNNGEPESEQAADSVIKKIKGEATNRNIQGGLTVTFAKDKDSAPTVEQVSGNDLDKRYIESNKEILRKIMIAHGVISPALFGVMSESLFGSKEEMEVAFLLFQESYSKYRQRNLTEPMAWAQQRLNGWIGTFAFNPHSPKIFEVKPEVVQPVIEPVQMKKEITDDEIVGHFAKCGISKKDIKVLKSRPYDYTDNEAEFKSTFSKLGFATITEEQNTILTMIKNGEDYRAVNEAIGKGGAYLSQQLIKLGKAGLIDGWKLTDAGENSIIEEIEIEVLYSYELREDAPALLPGGTSRPFCKALMDLDRLYTKSEIDQISVAVDRDVWRYRGGWYHNPDTNRNTPSCRHDWQQNLITR